MTCIKLSPISKVQTNLLPTTQHEQESLPSPPITSSPILLNSLNHHHHQQQQQHSSLLTIQLDQFFSSITFTLNLATRFSLSFFLFGLLNNVLYVIIISAALDLVPSNIPTGVILVADILPSLIVKLGWPYLVNGPILYSHRILSCSTLSFLGMMVIVFSDSIFFRLAGISLASISSGLGEMTFLQLSTKYQGSPGVSWFASGTGAAGVLGAGLWWLLRSLGIRIGLGLSSILPLCLSITYFLLLPRDLEINSSMNERGDYSIVPEGEQVEEEEEEDRIDGSTIHQSGNDVDDENPSGNKSSSSHLSLKEKLDLTKPLLVAYMLPLFTVYFAEYTINTGVAPTLLYPPPKPESHPIFSLVFKSLKDYYPFWQLTYQTFVFFSRSSMAIFKFPALPKSLIAIPSLIQFLIFLLVLMESGYDFLIKLFSKEWIFLVIFLLISLEGICGGLSYVSAYYWLGHDDQLHLLQPVQVEFRMACVGFADTLGILSASILSSWLEPRLCGLQVSRLKLLCKQVSQPGF